MLFSGSRLTFNAFMTINAIGPGGFEPHPKIISIYILILDLIKRFLIYYLFVVSVSKVSTNTSLDTTTAPSVK